MFDAGFYLNTDFIDGALTLTKQYLYSLSDKK